MKIAIWCMYPLLIIGVTACQQAVDSISRVSFTPSIMVVNTDQDVNISLIINTGNWTVVPPLTTKMYVIGSSRISYLNVNQAGVYTVMAKVNYTSYNSVSQPCLAGNAGNDAKLPCTGE